MISCSWALSPGIRNWHPGQARYVRDSEHVCNLLIREDAFERKLAAELRGGWHNRLLLRKACSRLTGALLDTAFHYLGQNNEFLEAC